MKSYQRSVEQDIEKARSVNQLISIHENHVELIPKITLNMLLKARTLGPTKEELFKMYRIACEHDCLKKEIKKTIIFSLESESRTLETREEILEFFKTMNHYSLWNKIDIRESFQRYLDLCKDIKDILELPKNVFHARLQQNMAKVVLRLIYDSLKSIESIVELDTLWKGYTELEELLQGYVPCYNDWFTYQWLDLVSASDKMYQEEMLWSLYTKLVKMENYELTEMVSDVVMPFFKAKMSTWRSASEAMEVISDFEKTSDFWGLGLEQALQLSKSYAESYEITDELIEFHNCGFPLPTENMVMWLNHLMKLAKTHEDFESINSLDVIAETVFDTDPCVYESFLKEWIKHAPDREFYPKDEIYYEIVARARPMFIKIIAEDYKVK